LLPSIDPPLSLSLLAGCRISTGKYDGC